MTARSPHSTAATPAAASTALGAFLRGVERRAAVFADLQCGDQSCADAAVQESLDGFMAVAGRYPVADWPQRYWALLLAAPSLRGQPATARWPDAFNLLAKLGRGPRAALLLSLVARLPEAEAAAVLGVAQPTYRLALQRALPSDAQGQPDVATWHALDRATRQALQALPTVRLLRLAGLREAALTGHKPVTGARLRADSGDRTRKGRGSPPAWLLPALWIALALCVAGLVASFVWPDGLTRKDDGPASTRMSPLPDAATPVARFDSGTALLTHPDFEQLANTEDAAVIDALDFYAWYAAGLESQPATPLSLPDAGQLLPEPQQDPDTTPEDADAPQ